MPCHSSSFHVHFARALGGGQGHTAGPRGRLLELRHKRDLEVCQEQCQHLTEDRRRHSAAAIAFAPTATFALRASVMPTPCMCTPPTNQCVST